MKVNHIVIPENGVIGCNDQPNGDEFTSVKMDEGSFNELVKFNTDNDENFFSHTFVKAKNGSSVLALKAKNYVGVIETRKGTIVEILPKISKNFDETSTREVLFQMLSFLRDSPYKKVNLAHVKSQTNLLEIFISMFLDELGQLVRKGVVRDYNNIENNSSFLKGKLLFNQHIRSNFNHKERVFISFDEFLSNRPENRLIKSTLLFLFKKSLRTNNQKRIREFIFTLDEIPESENYEHDFLKIKTDRLVSHYERILGWCKVFLKRTGFTNFHGQSVSFAFLFPMEKIFEDFVGGVIKRGNPDWKVFLKGKSKYLIENHKGNPKFKLIPDILMIKDNKDKFETVILDTKWKLLDQNKEDKNYSLVQADLYQMFAYGHKHECNNVYLLYPQTEKFNSSLTFEYYKDNSKNPGVLEVFPVDLKKLVKEKMLRMPLDELPPNNP